MLGAKIAKAGAVPTEGGTTPSATTPDEVATAQKQQQALQWAIPALTGAIIVLGAQQGEQQRTGEVLKGFGSKLASVGRSDS